MDNSKIDKVKSTLELMEKFETWVARLYKECSQYLIEDEDFWMEMASSELKHGENIKRMFEIYSKAPEKFEIGRPFKDVIIREAMDNRAEDIEKIKNKSLTKANILGLSKEIELAILESRYNDFLISKDEEYTKLVESIVKDTREHLKNARPENQGL